MAAANARERVNGEESDAGAREHAQDGAKHEIEDRIGVAAAVEELAGPGLGGACEDEGADEQGEAAEVQQAGLPCRAHAGQFEPKRWTEIGAGHVAAAGGAGVGIAQDGGTGKTEAGEWGRRVLGWMRWDRSDRGAAAGGGHSAKRSWQP